MSGVPVHVGRVPWCNELATHTRHRMQILPLPTFAGAVGKRLGCNEARPAKAGPDEEGAEERGAEEGRGVEGGEWRVVIVVARRRFISCGRRWQQLWCR